MEFKEQNPKFTSDFVAYAILVRIDDTQHKYPKHIREEVDQVKQEMAAGADSEIFVLKLNKVHFCLINFIRWSFFSNI